MISIGDSGFRFRILIADCDERWARGMLPRAHHPFPSEFGIPDHHPKPGTRYLWYDASVAPIASIASLARHRSFPL